MDTKLSFLSFKSKRINFKVSLITLHHLSIIFDFIRNVIPLAFSIIYIAVKSSMFLLSTILILKNARIHVGFLNGCNMPSYIKISINKTLDLYTILRVLNINLYNSYI